MSDPACDADPLLALAVVATVAGWLAWALAYGAYLRERKRNRAARR